MKKPFTIYSIIKSAIIAMLFAVPIYGEAQTNIAPNAVVTATGTGAAGCQTGPCSTVNDLNFGSCGSQQMWINTATPPSSTPGDDWIQFDFPTPEAMDEIIIHHAQDNARFLSGGLIQVWSAGSWVTHHHFTNLPMACVSSITFQKVVTSRFRITAFEMTRSGQLSNPNFREIEVMSAPTAYNDAMVQSTSPDVFCPGSNDIYATIGNYGLNQINSVEIHWEVNGVSMPVVFYGQLLDTLNGTFPNTAIVKLGSVNLTTGSNSLEVYTKNPNGATDQFQFNDTLRVTLQTLTAPTGISSSNPTPTSIDINVNGSANNMEYEYGPVGFTLGSGTRGTASTNPFTISGLNSNTQYDVYIRNLCGSASSTWTGPQDFVTGCTNVSTFPYTENFDGPTTNGVWNCWTVYNIDGGNTWNQNNTFLTPHSGQYVAHGMGNNNDFLISPRFDLPTSPMWLQLWDIVEDSSFSSTYYVLVSTTGIDTADFTDTIGTYTVTNETWVERTFDLTPYANQNIHIGIWQSFSASASWAFGIDDFMIHEIPTCLKPSNLTAANITFNSAVLGWTENNVSTQWEIEYGPSGFIRGTGNRVLTTSNPHSVTGLTNGPNFDFYVRSICGRNDSSIWAGPFTFRTLTYSIASSPPLTASTSTSTNSGVTMNVEAFNSLNILEFATTTVATTTGYEVWYSTDSVNGPPNITTANGWVLHETGPVTGAGTPYSIQLITPLLIPGGETYGIFLRMLGSSIYYASSPSPTVFSDPNIRLEVGDAGYAGVPPTPTLHPRAFAGEIVYELVFRGTNDAAVVSIDSVLAVCAGPQDVYATIENEGINQIDSVEVHWEVNGAPQPMVHYKQLLDTAGGAFPSTASILLGTANMVSGNNNIKVWTSMPNGAMDTLNDNDTIINSLFSPSSPSGVSFSNSTLTSVDVNVIGSTGTIDYEYGPVGFIQGNGISGSATTNPFTLSGLSPSSIYEMYVRNNCGSGSSIWAGPFKFQTISNAPIDSVSSFPDLAPNNGQSGVSFNVGAYVDLKVIEIKNTFNTGSIPYTIWYSTDSVNGPPTITTANNWIAYQTGTVAGNNTSPVSIPLNFPIEIPAGETYGFFIEAGTRYHTNTAASPTMFADGNVYLNTGNNVGYGGAPPNPTFHIRQFVGTIIYELNPKGPNNAGVESIDSVIAVCPGPQDVYATIENAGINQIDSVEVHWEVNGTPQTMVHYKQLLDTAGGTFPSSASILLGTANMVSGNNNIKVWTSMPNGVADTLNANDTIVNTLFSPGSPTGTNISNITSSSVDVTVSGSVGSIDYEYGPTGFVLGNGTTGNSTTNPFTISGLNQNTVYDIYVRNNCGSSTTSSWSGPFEFVTGCSSVSSFPYTEDFDGPLTNSVWNCWTVIDRDGGNTWNQNNIFLTARSAPFVAHGMGNNDDLLISPQFVLPTTPMWLKLWDRVESATQNSIYSVLVSTTGTNPLDFTDTLGTFNVTNIDWTERTFDLSAYANQNIHIALWQSFSASASWAFGIDDFLIEQMPTCLEPTNLTATNVSMTSADIDWTENNVATQWQIEYGPLGFTPGTGTVQTVSSKPHTLSGLSPSTSYEYYVRAICGRNDSSKWAGPLQFNTAIGVPYMEDFETFGSKNPASGNGWSVVGNSLMVWQSGTSTTSGSTGPTQDHTIGAGGTFVFLETSSGAAGDTAHFVSPPMYVDTNLHNIDFEFWYHKYGATMDDLAVFVESNGVSTLITTIPGQTHTSGTDPWLSYSTVLTGYAGQSIQLRFSGVRGSSFTGDMAIDDISLSVQVPIDGELSDFVPPTTATCYTSAENVGVVLTNVGTDPLDFTVDSALITVDVTGASTQTISFNVNNNSINSGNPLAPFSSIIVPVGTVDMTSPGTYYFDALLSMANDGLSINNVTSDTIVGSRNGTIIGSTSLCMGDTTTAFITEYRGSVQWQSSTGGAFTDIPGATGSSIRTAPTGPTQYRVITCGNLVSDTLTLSPTTPTTPLGTDGMLTVNCGDPGVVYVVATSANPNAKFEWYDSPQGGNVILVGGTIHRISQYGDTLYYQASPTLGNMASDTFYVQEIVLSGSGICSSTRDTVVATIDCIVGMDNIEGSVSSINIYPNPSKGIFKLVGNDIEEEIEVSIFNTNGKMVYQLNKRVSNSFEEQIDISGLAKGMYFVRLQGKSSMEMKKIVIQ